MAENPYEIGSEAWVKEQIRQKLSPDERDKPKTPAEGKYPVFSLGSGS